MKTIFVCSLAILFLGNGKLAFAQACLSDTGYNANQAYRNCEDKYCDPGNEKECMTKDTAGYLACTQKAVEAYSAAVDSCHEEVQKDITAAEEARKKHYNQICGHDSECAKGLRCRFAGWEGVPSACLP